MDWIDKDDKKRLLDFVVAFGGVDNSGWNVEAKSWDKSYYDDDIVFQLNEPFYSIKLIVDVGGEHTLNLRYSYAVRLNRYSWEYPAEDKWFNTMNGAAEAAYEHLQELVAKAYSSVWGRTDKGMLEDMSGGGS